MTNNADMLSLWAALQQIAEETPMMVLSKAMDKAEKRVLGLDTPPTPPVNLPPWFIQNPVALGKWAGENVPSAVLFIKEQKLINAIKEIRAASLAGLKEAKEAAEALRYQMGLAPKPNYYNHTYGDSKYMTYDDYYDQCVNEGLI